MASATRLPVTTREQFYVQHSFWRALGAHMWDDWKMPYSGNGQSELLRRSDAKVHPAPPCTPCKVSAQEYFSV